jgi:putative copper export protein
MQKFAIFGIIRSLHNLFTAFWVGGMLTTAISFMPVYKKFGKQSDVAKSILIKYQEKLRIVAVISIIVLWITGVLMGKQSPQYASFMSFGSQYETLVSVKHMLIFVMIIIAIYRGFVLGAKIKEFTPKKMKAYGVLLMVNTLLGIAVLFLSSISAAIP